MASHNKSITTNMTSDTVDHSSELVVGPSGIVRCLVTGIDAPVVVTLQERYDTDWVDTQGTRSGSGTIGFRSYAPGSVMRVKLEGVFGEAAVTLITG